MKPTAKREGPTNSMTGPISKKWGSTVPPLAYRTASPVREGAPYPIGPIQDV